MTGDLICIDCACTKLARRLNFVEAERDSWQRTSERMARMAVVYGVMWVVALVALLIVLVTK